MYMIVPLSSSEQAEVCQVLSFDCFFGKAPLLNDDVPIPFKYYLLSSGDIMP